MVRLKKSVTALSVPCLSKVCLYGLGGEAEIAGTARPVSRRWRGSAARRWCRECESECRSWFFSGGPIDVGDREADLAPARKAGFRNVAGCSDKQRPRRAVREGADRPPTLRRRLHRPAPRSWCCRCCSAAGAGEFPSARSRSTSRRWPAMMEAGVPAKALTPSSPALCHEHLANPAKTFEVPAARAGAARHRAGARTAAAAAGSERARCRRMVAPEARRRHRSTLPRHAQTALLIRSGHRPSCRGPPAPALFPLRSGAFHACSLFARAAALAAALLPAVWAGAAPLSAR